MTKTTVKPFCAYEHLGGCSDWLTHRVNYWLGAAKERFGPWAYYCSNHAKDAGHLHLIDVGRPILRRTGPGPVKEDV